MPVKYIGRVTDYAGKPLWRILYNLKNFGVGRIVYRNMFQRYPEPSYYIITQIDQNPECKTVRIQILYCHNRKLLRNLIYNQVNSYYNVV